MSFRVEWQLDLSDGFDENSLLGRIELTDGIHRIAEESVYLDSWLDSLLAASRAVRRNSGKASIEIPEHRQRLGIHSDRVGAVHVSFGDEVVVASSDEFEQAILSAIAGFTDEVSKLSGKEYDLPGIDARRTS